jgi:predicted DNA-binding transcriptional regulator YafY
MPRTFIARFKKIDRLIQQKATGNAATLSAKLQICERTLKEFIAVMKEHGAPIYFDRIKNSYCYKEHGSFNISFIIVQSGCTEGF